MDTVMSLYMLHTLLFLNLNVKLLEHTLVFKIRMKEIKIETWVLKKWLLLLNYNFLDNSDFKAFLPTRLNQE